MSSGGVEGASEVFPTIYKGLTGMRLVTLEYGSSLRLWSVASDSFLRKRTALEELRRVRSPTLYLVRGQPERFARPSKKQGECDEDNIEKVKGWLRSRVRVVLKRRYARRTLTLTHLVAPQMLRRAHVVAAPYNTPREYQMVYD